MEYHKVVDAIQSYTMNSSYGTWTLHQTGIQRTEVQGKLSNTESFNSEYFRKYSFRTTQYSQLSGK